MKFLIGGVAFILTAAFFLTTAKCVYLGFTDSWTWFLVALPLTFTTVILGLITSLGLSIPFQE